MTDLPHLKARPLSRFYGLMTSKLGVSTQSRGLTVVYDACYIESLSSLAIAAAVAERWC